MTALQKFSKTQAKLAKVYKQQSELRLQVLEEIKNLLQIKGILALADFEICADDKLYISWNSKNYTQYELIALTNAYILEVFGKSEHISVTGLGGVIQIEVN